MTMFPDPAHLDLKDYHYELPEDRIAAYPLEERDSSRLIIYENRKISMAFFRDLSDYIPRGSLMVFNETRVIQARLHFRKASGAQIEIFCLEPASKGGLPELAFQQYSPVSWKCLVGNLKKWKQGPLTREVRVNAKRTILQANLIRPYDEAFLVEFSWEDPVITFSELLDACGQVPLPPYIRRPSVDSDKFRYQTIYARNDGSVAAPTAGLHFTENIFRRLNEKDVLVHKLTLHVSAGTFKPISAASVSQHHMHAEQVSYKRIFIESLIGHSGKPLCAVGTTSVRSLESLYWLGVQLIHNGEIPDRFHVKQWEPYQKGDPGITAEQALSAILDHMKRHDMDALTGDTQLMIIPGYDFRFVDGLITNFHMPRSTLLLLVAAVVGSHWKKVYETALKNDFRFLSYGDSCLLFRDV